MKTWLKIVILIVALGCIILRLFWPNLKIDAITIGLLIVAVLPWFSSLIESAKFPGGWELKLRDMEEKVEKTVQEASATIDDLRRLGIPLFISTLQMFVMRNRMVNQDYLETEQRKVVHEFDDICKALSVEDERINYWKDRLNQTYGWDRFRKILYSLGKASLNTLVDEERKRCITKLEEFQTKLQKFPTRREVEEILSPLKDQLETERKRRVHEAIEGYGAYYERYLKKEKDVEKDS